MNIHDATTMGVTLTSSSGVPPSLNWTTPLVGVVSIVVSTPASLATPSRHSVQERMARERRRINFSSTYDRTRTMSRLCTNEQNTLHVREAHRTNLFVHFSYPGRQVGERSKVQVVNQLLNLVQNLSKVL